MDTGFPTGNSANSPLTAQVVSPPPAEPPRRGAWGCGWALAVLLLIVLAASLLANLGMVGLLSLRGFETEERVQERFYSHNEYGTQKVAIISLEGTILTGEGFIKRQIDRAAKDPAVRAVVLRVDSPGGTITGSDLTYHRLRKLAEESKIPIVVSMGGLAASGGYYVSMAVGDAPESVFAEPTTWTGSIGVVIPHYDLSKFLGTLGVHEDSIASDRLKTMGSFAKPMTEEERKIFQALVDEGFSRFKTVIKQGRPRFRKDPAALDRLATGQVYTAEQALKNGLIDKIGFLEDAVDRAIELAKLDKSDVRVVQYKPEPNLVDILLGGGVQTRQPDLAALLELTAPRAYYLCTWLPALASSGR